MYRQHLKTMVCAKNTNQLKKFSHFSYFLSQHLVCGSEQSVVFISLLRDTYINTYIDILACMYSFHVV